MMRLNQRPFNRVLVLVLMLAPIGTLPMDDVIDSIMAVYTAPAHRQLAMARDLLNRVLADLGNPPPMPSREGL